MSQKFVIGLPAYNEGGNIQSLLDRIHQIKASLGDQLSVLIVNDGSTDNTEDILQQYCHKYDYIKYINHPQNMGLGSAVSTLLNYAVNKCEDEDILITFDADNTHNPEIIPSMISSLINNHLDIVIASRFTKGGKEIGLSLIRKIYSRGAMIFCKLIFHIHNVNDYSCGYRAYHIGFLKRLISIYGDDVVSAKGFECMVEILAKAGKIGVKAGECPLVLEYNLKQGESKMNVKKTILGYMRLAFKIRKPKGRIEV